MLKAFRSFLLLFFSFRVRESLIINNLYFARFNRILSAIPDKKNYSTDKTILLVCHAIIVFKVICMFILKFKIIVLHFPICNICSHYLL